MGSCEMFAAEWIGDGSCDRDRCGTCAFFTKNGLFDGGDCPGADEEKAVGGKCDDSCEMFAAEWIGDGSCDRDRCGTCAFFTKNGLFDGGDCPGADEEKAVAAAGLNEEGDCLISFYTHNNGGWGGKYHPYDSRYGPGQDCPIQHVGEYCEEPWDCDQYKCVNNKCVASGMKWKTEVYVWDSRTWDERTKGSEGINKAETSVGTFAVQQKTSYVLNGFALLGFGALLYGAVAHYCKKQQQAVHVEF